MQRVYLDNAASAPLDPEVLEVMVPLMLAAGNPSSTHAHGRDQRSAVETARKTIAQCLGCSPSEIYFTSGGTEADNTAIYGAVRRYGLTHIISTAIEHHAVTHPIEDLEAAGTAHVTWLKVDEKGHISLAELEEALTNNPRSLVSLMHANNEIGTVHDIVAIGELCKKYNALFHCDTVQTLGHLPLNLASVNVHYVTGAAHKFYGPKGIGFLFIRKGFPLPPLVNGGAQERNMRAGTENVAGIVGMAHALKKCVDHLDEKTAYLLELKSYAMTQLQANVPGVSFNGDTDPAHANPTVLNFSLPIDENDLLLSGMLIFRLDLEGVSVSAGSACSSGATQGSHVLNSLGLPPSRSINAIRMSFSGNNTREEVDFAIAAIVKVLNPQPVA